MTPALVEASVRNALPEIRTFALPAWAGAGLTAVEALTFALEAAHQATAVEPVLIALTSTPSVDLDGRCPLWHAHFGLREERVADVAVGLDVLADDPYRSPPVVRAALMPDTEHTPRAPLPTPVVDSPQALIAMGVHRLRRPEPDLQLCAAWDLERPVWHLTCRAGMSWTTDLAAAADPHAAPAV